MIAKLTAHPDQVRWYASSALMGFDTLEGQAAVEHAKHDLRAIIAYLDALDAADDAVLVSGVKTIEPGVRLKVIAGDSKGSDVSNLENVG